MLHHDALRSLQDRDGLRPRARGVRPEWVSHVRREPGGVLQRRDRGLWTAHGRGRRSARPAGDSTRGT